MSRLFYDSFIEIKRVKIHIDRLSEDHLEKTDMWDLVDEYINRRVLNLILSELSDEYHYQFLNMFLDKPYDENIILFLNERLSRSLESIFDDNLPLINSELEEVLEIKKLKAKKKKYITKKTEGDKSKK